MPKVSGNLLPYTARGSSHAYLQQRLGTITGKLDPGAEASCNQDSSRCLWAVSCWRHLQCTVQMSLSPEQMQSQRKLRLGNGETSPHF
jgi:hypothetical protein